MRSSEREVDQFADTYVPAAPLEPEFEDFLGKLVKKIGKGVKSVAKTAAKGVATLGLGAGPGQDQGAGQAAAQPGAAEGASAGCRSRSSRRRASSPSGSGLRRSRAGAAAPRRSAPGPEPVGDAGDGGRRHRSRRSIPRPTRVRPCRRRPAPTCRRCSSSSIGRSRRRCCRATRVPFELELARTRASSNGQAARPVFTRSRSGAPSADRSGAGEPQGRREPGAVRRELPARGVAGRAASRRG